MSDIVDDDRPRLHSLGHAQELKRGMGTFSNLAISFSIISILAGGFTGFRIGAIYGGSLVISLGWVIVGLMALFVGMSMGEICSAYPTAGGLYFWSAKLDRKNNALWAWFAGWFTFIGQIGVIASVAFALANYIVAFVNLLGDISLWSGGFSTLDVFFIGFLLAQYMIIGFDASAHVSEETVGARIGAPKAIVRSIYTSAIAALVLN